MHIILISHLYLFQNVLIDLLIRRGSYYNKKYNAILHRMLNLGHGNLKPIFQKINFRPVATSFLYGYIAI